MSLWIEDSNILPPAWISSAGIWSLPGDFYFSNFAIAMAMLIPAPSAVYVCFFF
jgi:hypothetical protein